MKILSTLFQKLIFTTLILASIFLVANTAIAGTRNINAKSNTKTLFSYVVIFNTTTCYSGPLPRIDKSQAEHGKLLLLKSIIKAEGGKCKGKKIKGYKVYYKSNPGFRGSDKVLLKYSYKLNDVLPGRKSRTIHGVITVK